MPSLLFEQMSDSGCTGCPEHLLLIEPNDDLAALLRIVAAALYVGLFVLVLRRTSRRWRDASRFERLQLTPVYVCALLTFALVTIAQAGAGDAAWWPAFVSTALLPFAFLASLLRSARLPARRRAGRAARGAAGVARRGSCTRPTPSGGGSSATCTTARSRAWSRWPCCCGRRARGRRRPTPGLAELLDQAQEELQTSLGELRELARGIHPAVLSERGLEPALHALAARAPVPVEVEVGAERLPEPVESAAYFVVSEALTNVAKYAEASHATVAVTRENGRVLVEVADDGVGGASADAGSGLRGLADRIAALDGTLSIESPRGQRHHAARRDPGQPLSSARRPDARATGRATAARTAASPPTRISRSRARVTAV